jgi:hypothetical protein
LCIFNDGTDTHMYLHPGNVSYSAIELTVTDPSLLLEFSWKVHGDHFPITLESLSSTIGKDLHDINLTKLTGLYANRCSEENFKCNLLRVSVTLFS